MLEHFKARYPHLYSGCREISCGAGWYSLIENASADLHALALRTGVGISISDIRQKYGVLRLWVCAQSANVDKAAEEIAGRAETASETACELCGAPGTLRTDGGWLRVGCWKCG